MYSWHRLVDQLLILRQRIHGHFEGNRYINRSYRRYVPTTMPVSGFAPGCGTPSIRTLLGSSTAPLVYCPLMLN